MNGCTLADAPSVVSAVLTDVDIVKETERNTGVFPHKSFIDLRAKIDGRFVKDYCTSIDGTFHVDGNDITTHSTFHALMSLPFFACHHSLM